MDIGSLCLIVGVMLALVILAFCAGYMIGKLNSGFCDTCKLRHKCSDADVGYTCNKFEKES